MPYICISINPLHCEFFILNVPAVVCGGPKEGNITLPACFASRGHS